MAPSHSGSVGSIKPFPISMYYSSAPLPPPPPPARSHFSLQIPSPQQHTPRVEPQVQLMERLDHQATVINQISASQQDIVNHVVASNNAVTRQLDQLRSVTSQTLARVDQQDMQLQAMQTRLDQITGQQQEQATQLREQAAQLRTVTSNQGDQTTQLQRIEFQMDEQQVLFQAESAVLRSVEQQVQSNSSKLDRCSSILDDIVPISQNAATSDLLVS